MMFCYAAAPAGAPAPELWARYTQVMELRLSWDDVGGPPEADEIETLAGMVNIYREAQERKSRVQGKSFGG